MKTILRFLLRIFFRFRVENENVLSTPGPVVLLPNHSSWFDWLFLAACVDTRWKFVTSMRSAQISWVHRFIMVNRFTFPVEIESPYSVKHIAEYLQQGGRLVLFPEGRLSRTGTLMKLFDGTGFLLSKSKARVITCYIRNAQKLPFSPNPNKKQFFPRVSVHFSEALTAPEVHDSAMHIRHKLNLWLYDRMVEQRFKIEMAAAPGNVFNAVVKASRKRMGQVVVEDFSFTKLTYRKLLTGADALSRQWKKRLSPENGEHVGVLLPNTNATPLTLLSLWAVNKVPAVLNYSTGIPTMLTCLNVAGVKKIITSRQFIERAKLNIQPLIEAGIELIYLEDVRSEISTFDQLVSLLRVSVSPSSVVDNPQATAVILFTSGSEGIPKAVALTHWDLLSNIHQMLSVIDLMERDRIFNALPLFHSFGLTVGLLLPLVYGGFVFLYPSPLHYRIVPTLLYELDCTVFFATNTFLNGYARKAHPYDFRSVRYLFAGAEKLQQSTADIWAQRFGIRILEGYGATECSPCIAADTPIHPHFGSVGRFLPCIEYKLEPVDGVSDGGRLWVRGPNIMQGYLNAEANAKFKAQDGWYDTGDIARVDEDGFLFLLGRLKRFAKVSGEMVSLTAIEEALAGAFTHYGLRCEVAILSQPDDDRGEALIAVTNEPKIKLEDLRPLIKSRGLSNLSLPREIKYVREIPKLGTGKVNHRELEKMI